MTLPRAGQRYDAEPSTPPEREGTAPMAPTDLADPTDTDVDTSGLPPEQDWEYEVDAAVYDEPLPLDETVFTSTGLQIDIEHMEFDEWARLGGVIDRIAKRIQWLGGDWHNAGEDKWNDEIWQVLDEFSANTIRNWGIVCRAFPYEDRVAGVDFTHYKYAADLRTLPSRRKCMRQVIENDWTTRETEAYVKEILGKDKNDDKKGKGETTSVTWSLGWNLAPADEAAGDVVAVEVMEFIEKTLAEHGVDARGVNSPNKTYNES